VLEAAALSLPATVVFRSGILLVKLAAAGRIAARLVREEAALTTPRTSERPA
jgi:hypothetical protein